MTKRAKIEELIAALKAHQAARARGSTAPARRLPLGAHHPLQVALDRLAQVREARGDLSKLGALAAADGVHAGSVTGVTLSPKTTNPKEKPMQCSSCLYFNRSALGHQGEDEGLCYRYPPKVLVCPPDAAKGIDGIVTVWPEVFETDFCGEFKASLSDGKAG